MKTLVIGASLNPARYSFKAIEKLYTHGFAFLALGKSPGELFGQPIHTKKEMWNDIDTISLYLSPVHQKEYYNYIESLTPRRVIFNPGTENSEFETLLQKGGIIAERACTLVLLSTNQYESQKG